MDNLVDNIHNHKKDYEDIKHRPRDKNECLLQEWENLFLCAYFCKEPDRERIKIME